jgi:hypothetical protein
MTSGNWKLNADCIRFNGNGDLIDGQHRLRACIESGCSFDTYVAVNLDHDAFDTIDQGRKRTIGDIFTRQGHANYNTLSGAIRTVWRLERGFTVSKGAMRADEANAVLETNPTIHDACAVARNLCGRRKLIGPAVLAGLIHMTRKKNKAQADAFWEAVMIGDGMSKTDAAFVLRERLIANIGSMTKIQGDNLIALCIKAWNSHRDGGPCRVLKYDYREEFPKIK